MKIRVDVLTSRCVGVLMFMVRKTFITLMFVLSMLSSVFAQQQPQVELAKQWQTLIDQGKQAEAEKLCTGWLTEKDSLLIIEAHKCLANAALKTPLQILVANDVGGGNTISGFPVEEIRVALGHLDTAVSLGTQDITVFLGRFDLLMLAGLFNELPIVLEDSIQRYKQPDALEYWFRYSSQLFEYKNFKEALAYGKVLEKHYPNEYRVMSNMGAYYSMLEQDKEAEAYLLKAIALKSDDALANWNLARLYDYTGDVQKADAQYQKSLKLFSASEEEPLIKEHCVYADFVESKLKDHVRACTHRKQYCVEDVAAKCK